MLKTEVEDLIIAFLSVWQMLMHSKIMSNRYYCIKTFCDVRKLDIFKENVLENSYIRRLNFREKGTFITACVLLRRFHGIHNVTVDVKNLDSLLFMFQILTLDYVMSLERVLRKPLSWFITTCEFPCQNMDLGLLKHGC